MSLITKEQAVAISDDLVAFVHRVVQNENATPAEIAALPEIARLLLGTYGVL